MEKEKRDKRIIIPFNRSEIEAIEAWWHKKMLPSRAAAIRELICLGMADALVATRPSHQNFQELAGPASAEEYVRDE